ncbi:MAG: iron-sulfur cluster assembly accessory protein [Alphaproteobacteria bacterium]|nr:iron-sulfur cluster assembly accessory protein [Alphaproteobacteria bacterium]
MANACDSGLETVGAGRATLPPPPAAAVQAAQRPGRPSPLTVTPAAIERVQQLLASRGKPSAGVRIGIRTRGCSGMAYTLEFADQAHPMDEVVAVTTADGQPLTILIDPKAVLFLLGTEMDFVESALESGFTFRNPNEKGRCGCGESFHV